MKTAFYAVLFVCFMVVFRVLILFVRVNPRKL